MTLPLPNWGVRIALVYIVFASATLGFVVFAMSQHVDLVAPDYYARSLTHDQKLDAVARVEALGNGFGITTSADGRAVRLVIPAEASADLRGAVTLYRPADSSADRRYELTVDRQGRQDIDLTTLAAGPWRLQMDWTAGGHTYYAERTVVLR